MTDLESNNGMGGMPQLHAGPPSPQLHNNNNTDPLDNVRSEPQAPLVVPPVVSSALHPADDIENSIPKTQLRKEKTDNHVSSCNSDAPYEEVKKEPEPEILQDEVFNKSKTVEVDVEDSPCAKKMRRELGETLESHSRLVSEAIAESEEAALSGPELERLTEGLTADIAALRQLAAAKEREWNALLRLRKVKEEILLRLLRRKRVLDIEAGEEEESPNQRGASRANGRSPNSNAVWSASTVGRQGPVKDVQSIIADYRQRHPETVPRRGRRLKSLLPQAPGPRAPAPPPRLPPPTPTSRDGTLSMSRIDGGLHMSGGEVKGSGLLNGINFKDVLVQLSGHPPPAYPEVTLHPVEPAAPAAQEHNNSLLHGILTKPGGRQEVRPPTFSTFSPTLARLLTAPEKILPPNSHHNNYSSQKVSEITITPVVLGSGEESPAEEDSADRPLVIDEAGAGAAGGAGGGAVELPESEVPSCQGCRRREAQFVCAGCANQWYCSRDCQVAAWDEHSEVCSG